MALLNVKYYAKTSNQDKTTEHSLRAQFFAALPLTPAAMAVSHVLVAVAVVVVVV